MSELGCYAGISQVAHVVCIQNTKKPQLLLQLWYCRYSYRLATLLMLTVYTAGIHHAKPAARNASDITADVLQSVTLRRSTCLTRSYNCMETELLCRRLSHLERPFATCDVGTVTGYLSQSPHTHLLRLTDSQDFTAVVSCPRSDVTADMFVVFIARQHTDARYWYSNSVRLFTAFRYSMETA